MNKQEKQESNIISDNKINNSFNNDSKALINYYFPRILKDLCSLSHSQENLYYLNIILTNQDYTTSTYFSNKIKQLKSLMFSLIESLIEKEKCTKEFSFHNSAVNQDTSGNINVNENNNPINSMNPIHSSYNCFNNNFYYSPYLMSTIEKIKRQLNTINHIKELILTFVIKEGYTVLHYKNCLMNPIISHYLVSIVFNNKNKTNDNENADSNNKEDKPSSLFDYFTDYSFNNLNMNSNMNMSINHSNLGSNGLGNFGNYISNSNFFNSFNNFNSSGLNNLTNLSNLSNLNNNFRNNSIYDYNANNATSFNPLSFGGLSGMLPLINNTSFSSFNNTNNLSNNITNTSNVNNVNSNFSSDKDFFYNQNKNEVLAKPTPIYIQNIYEINNNNMKRNLNNNNSINNSNDNQDLQLNENPNIFNNNTSVPKQKSFSFVNNNSYINNNLIKSFNTISEISKNISNNNNTKSSKSSKSLPINNGNNINNPNSNEFKNKYQVKKIILNNNLYFHFTKRENIDKTVIRKFRKYLFSYVEKNRNKLTGDTVFWEKFCYQNLLPPFNPTHSVNIGFKSFSTDYMIWLFSHDGGKELFDQFFCEKKEELSKVFTIKFTETHVSGIISYVEKMALIFSGLETYDTENVKNNNKNVEKNDTKNEKRKSFDSVGSSNNSNSNEEKSNNNSNKNSNNKLFKTLKQ